MQVCRACARRCHGNHNTVAVFVRWVPNQDRCGCAESGSCRATWSNERSVFDKFVNESTRNPGKEEILDMQDFRELLQTLHPEKLSEDDIDSGEVALHSVTGQVTWPLFEKWHTPYFEVSQLALQDMSNIASSI